MKEDFKIIFQDLKDLNLKSLTLKETEKIRNLNIFTLHDLLYYFPRAYDDRTNIKKIEELRGDEYVVLKVQFMTISNPFTPSRLKMTKARATDGTGVIDVVWFQMPYLAKSLKIGEDYILIGHVKRGYNFQMTNPEYKKLSNQIEMEKGEILPVYSTVKNFAQNSLRRVLKKNITANKKYFIENIPKEILEKYRIMERQTALNEIHFPKNHKNLEEAKRRFAVEELLILEMGILANKYIEGVSDEKKYELRDNRTLVKKYLQNLSFELTNAQKNVIKDIYKELNRGVFINLSLIHI